jgi:hypothetical protein
MNRMRHGKSTLGLAFAAALSAGCHDLSYTAPCDLDPSDPRCPGADAAGDLGVDSTFDAASDMASDAQADAPADSGTEATLDSSADVAPDAAGDAAVDASDAAEAAVDAASDVADSADTTTVGADASDAADAASVRDAPDSAASADTADAAETPPSCAAAGPATQACGKCGSQSRTCVSEGVYGAWGTCGGEGACAPGATQAATGTTCAGALEVATQTCSAGCAWGAAVCALPKGWTKIAAPPAGFVGRYGHAAVWTGKEMIVWGGSDAANSYRADGARFDPKTNTWKSMAASPPGFSARGFSGSAWTGVALAVWGGRGASGPLSDGALYDPAGDAWFPMTSPAISGRSQPGTSWVAGPGKLVVWGGDGSVALADGAAWSGFSSTWAALPASPLLPRFDFVQASDSTSVTIWGGRDDSANPYRDGARYDVVAGTWSTLPSVPPSYSDRFLAGWAALDDGFIVAGGLSLSGPRDDGIAWYAGAFHMLPPAPSSTSPAPHGFGTSWCLGHVCSFWAGGVLDGTGTLLDTGVTYDVDRSAWSAMPTTGAPSARDLASVVVAAGSAIVWGGTTSNKPPLSTFSDGAIFVP